MPEKAFLGAYNSAMPTRADFSSRHLVLRMTRSIDVPHTARSLEQRAIWGFRGGLPHVFPYVLRRMKGRFLNPPFCFKFFVSAFEGALRGGQVGDFDGCMRMDGLRGWEVDWLSRPFPV